MAIGVVKNESTLALVVESTEGVYNATSSGADYVEPLADALEFNKTRELLERDLLGSTVEKEAARVGMSEIVGTIGVELKANATQGGAPQSMDILLRALLGGKRQITSEQTSDDTSHTSTVIYFADTSAFSVGDIVLIKEAGAYEVRPISAITTNTSITLAIALENGAPSNEVVVAKCTTYYHDTNNAPAFSAEHNLGTAAIKQKVAGLRSASMSIESWTVGQIPTASFSVQGTSLERVDEDASYTGTFTDALPPIALSACMWVGGQKISYTEFGASIENTISYIMDACAESGKIGSRITDQTTTVNVNPYLDDTSLANTWNKFNANDDVNFFIYAYNPSATAGEFSEVVAMWLPQAKIIESPIADNDGILSEALTLRAHRSSGNDSVFLGFI